MKGATRKKLKYDVEEEKWGMEQPAPCKPPPLPQVEEELGSHEPPPSLRSNMAVGSRDDTTTAPGSRLAGAHGAQKTILDYAERKPPEPAGSPTHDDSQPLAKEEKDCFERSIRREQGATEGADLDRADIMKEEISRTPQNTLRREENKRNTMMIATPSMGNAIKCSINRKGFCSTHGVQAKKSQISSQKWRDRGGGRGFGYVTVKSTKYLCKPGILAKRIDHIEPESRNLDKPGCEDNNLTGRVRDLDEGVSLSNNYLEDRQIKESRKSESGSADGD